MEEFDESYNRYIITFYYYDIKNYWYRFISDKIPTKKELETIGSYTCNIEMIRNFSTWILYLKHLKDKDREKWLMKNE